jgi:3-hydroxy-9,10-secoandrosta-1,3,5(10)-triene-9,17-dione monooxygenase reductase component
MTSTFSPRDFRDSLGLFATGIAIATASDGAERVGITINSFASVSIEPPLVLFSVSRSLRSFPVFERANGFAINVLGKDQKDLSTRFSKPGEDKWAGIDAATGTHGGVVIRPSLASFDCKLHRVFDGGDHLIFVGEVVALESAGVHEPLIYFRSRYHEIASGQMQAA